MRTQKERLPEAGECAHTAVFIWSVGKPSRQLNQ